MSYRIHFVHLSDSHLGGSREWAALGNCPYRNLERVIDTLNGLPTQPDFVIHTGDVANHGDERAYELAAELFGRLSVPVYFVTGNHDVREHMRKHLSMGKREELLNDGDAICYRFSAGPEHFLVLDSQQPFAEAGHFGKLSEDQLDLVREKLSRDDGLLSVFIHHAPVDLDSNWCRKQVGMLNGEALHSALLENRSRLRGVFFGHIHRGVQVWRDGIHYASVASTFCQLNLWPDVEEASFDQDQQPSFNFVTLLPDRLIIKEHSVSTPIEQR